MPRTEPCGASVPVNGLRLYLEEHGQTPNMERPRLCGESDSGQFALDSSSAILRMAGEGVTRGAATGT